MSPELVGEFAPPWWSSARAIIRRGIEAGQQAQMPEPQRAFTHVFETDSETKSLTIVVVLWEQDDTPDDAVDAAYQVFVPELRQALINFYFAHGEAPDPDSEDDTQEIVDAVEPKVREAVISKLSGWEKARASLGLFNFDDQIGFDSFGWTETPNEPGQRTFTLRFENDGNNYEIDGRLGLSQIPDPGPCQDEAEAVRKARERVNAINAEIEQIVVSARLASPDERAALIAEARRIQREELRPATEALGAAQYALTRCFTLAAEQGPRRSLTST
jgi:hypothetical protein